MVHILTIDEQCTIKRLIATGTYREAIAASAALNGAIDRHIEHRASTQRGCTCGYLSDPTAEHHNDGTPCDDYDYLAGATQ